MGGFEPPVFCSQSRRDNQASLHPEPAYYPRRWKIFQYRDPHLGAAGILPLLCIRATERPTTNRTKETRLINQTKNPRISRGNLTFGAPGGTRTHNPQIRSLVLYPVELRAQHRFHGLANICPFVPPINREMGRPRQNRQFQNEYNIYLVVHCTVHCNRDLLNCNSFVIAS